MCFGNRYSVGVSRRAHGTAPVSPQILLFGNSKAVADFDTKAVSKIDQTWRIFTRRRSVKSTLRVEPRLPLDVSNLRPSVRPILRCAHFSRVAVHLRTSPFSNGFSWDAV
jgi:hypothetical protein